MNREQINLVQASFDKIVPIRSTAGRLFYQRLFELDPELRALFRTDMLVQSQKLMAMIELVVEHLNQFDQLLVRVRVLGQAHVGYGVQTAHYTTVGEALLWTLHTSLEEQFTLADEAAWREAYTLLADAMQAV
jgi:hemoglobin-like flavoprotein